MTVYSHAQTMTLCVDLMKTLVEKDSFAVDGADRWLFPPDMVMYVDVAI